MTQTSTDKILKAAADFKALPIRTATEAQIRQIISQVSTIITFCDSGSEADEAMREVRSDLRAELDRRGIAFRR